MCSYERRAGETGVIFTVFPLYEHNEPKDHYLGQDSSACGCSELGIPIALALDRAFASVLRILCLPG